MTSSWREHAYMTEKSERRFLSNAQETELRKRLGPNKALKVVKAIGKGLIFVGTVVEVLNTGNYAKLLDLLDTLTG